MFEELNELCKLYADRKPICTCATGKTNLIELDEKIEENITLSISLNSVENYNYIFVYVESDNKLVFKGVYYSSEEDIRVIYDDLKDEIKKLTVENFIKKYYKTLKNQYNNGDNISINIK